MMYREWPADGNLPIHNPNRLDILAWALAERWHSAFRAPACLQQQTAPPETSITQSRKVSLPLEKGHLLRLLQMIFFYSVGSRMQWHPIQLLIPLVFITLDGTLWQLLSSLFGFSASQWGAPTPPSGAARRASTQPDDAYANLYSGLMGMVVLPLCILSAFHLPGLVVAARQGGWRAVMRYLRTPRGRHPTQAQAGRPVQQAPPKPRVTLDQVADALRQLPTELHATDEQLHAMTVHELKERLQARKVDCSQFLEKQELLDQLHKCGGSSATSCTICCEEYQQDEPVRVLPCQHRYHLDCIDKWFLSSTDYSRPPACPLCNAELLSSQSTPSHATSLRS